MEIAEELREKIRKRWTEEYCKDEPTLDFVEAMLRLFNELDIDYEIWKEVVDRPYG